MAEATGQQPVSLEESFQGPLNLPDGFRSLTELYEGFKAPKAREVTVEGLKYGDHERNHLIPSLVSNIIPVEVSVGSSFARVVFDDWRAVPIETQKKIFTAGSRHSTRGAQEGFGNISDETSDAAEVNSLIQTHGGLSFEETVHELDLEFESIPQEVQDRMTEIIVSEGTIIGADKIKRILTLATFEIEHNVQSARVVEGIAPLRIPTGYAHLPAGEYFVLEREGSQTIPLEVIISENGDQKTFCGLCHQEAGHDDTCPVKTFSSQNPQMPAESQAE